MAYRTDQDRPGIPEHGVAERGIRGVGWVIVVALIAAIVVSIRLYDQGALTGGADVGLDQPLVEKTQ